MKLIIFFTVFLLSVKSQGQTAAQLQSQITALRKEKTADSIMFVNRFVAVEKKSSDQTIMNIDQNKKIKYLEDSTKVIRLDSTVILKDTTLTAKLPAAELLQKLIDLYNQSNQKQQALDDKVKAAAKTILQ